MGDLGTEMLENIRIGIFVSPFPRESIGQREGGRKNRWNGLRDG